MFRSRRPTVKPRVLAALLTLAAHAGLGVLLLLESRGAQRPMPVVRELQSIAITLLPLVRPSETTDSAGEVATSTDVLTGGVVREPVTSDRPPAAPPPTAITLPPSPAEPEAPAATERDAGEWYAQAEALAARFAEQHEAPPATIGKPLQPMREPCKPRERSFEWKSDSKSTGSGALTLGWEEPDPNKHLFDDMMAGRRMPSSVPDPNHCD